MSKTLREELDRLGFDWAFGTIVHQRRGGAAHGFSSILDVSDPLMDVAVIGEWHHVFAIDVEAIFIPACDREGDHYLQRIPIHYSAYLNGEPIPYPGLIRPHQPGDAW